MAIIAKNKGDSDYKPIPAGLHHAICTGVYDLGTQWNEKFQKGDRKVLIQWELPNERIEIDKDGEKLDLPKATSRQFTLSLHEKSHLRPFLEGWRGKSFTTQELLGFDIISVLGVNCQLQIIHREKEEKVYANVTTALPLQKGMDKLQPENPLRSFSIDDDDSPPEGTPDWIVDIIGRSEEMSSLPTHDNRDMLQEPPNFMDGPPATDDDDIPF